MSDCLYHEKQDLALCGVHALNNLLQGPAFGAGDLAAIALKLDEAERALLTDDTAAAVFAAEIAEGRSHRLDMSSGDFAFEVLAAALETRACHLINVDHASVAEAAGSCPEEEEGFLVHRSSHWFALRRVASLWWNVDSKLPRPTLIVTEDLSAFIGKLRAAGHTLHVCRSEAPLPLPQLLSGEGHEAVFHPLDYLLQYPPLDPNAPISYTPGALDLDDAATAAAFAEAESIADAEAAAQRLQAQEWGGGGEGGHQQIFGGATDAIADASTIGAAIGAASHQSVVPSAGDRLGGADGGSHGESQLDADAALAAALMAADMEELERQRQPRQTPTQALAQGAAAQAAGASALAVGTQRVVGQLSNELAGLGSAVGAWWRSKTTPRTASVEEGSSVAVAAAGGGAAGMVGGAGEGGRAGAAGGAAAAGCGAPFGAQDSRGPLMMAGATHRPPGYPPGAPLMAGAIVASPLALDRDTPQAAAVGIGAGAVAAAAAAGSGRGGQVVAGGSILDEWGRAAETSGAAAEAASRGVADGLQQQPSLSQWALAPHAPLVAPLVAPPLIDQPSLISTQQHQPMVTSSAPLVAVPSPPSLATASKQPSALSDGRSLSSRLVDVSSSGGGGGGGGFAAPNLGAAAAASSTPSSAFDPFPQRAPPPPTALLPNPPLAPDQPSATTAAAVARHPAEPAVRVPDLLSMGFIWDDIHAAIEKAAGDMTLAQEFLLDGTLHTAPTPPGGRILGLDPAPPQPPATTALASALQGDLQRVRDKPSTRQAGSRPPPQPARQPVAPAQPLVAQQPSQQPAGLVILDPD